MSRSSISSENVFIPGQAGRIEILADVPATVGGLALIGHPHPLFGGANTNKVVHTLARALRELGYAALRPNFRGVGKSEGVHDNGEGETEDMQAVLDWAVSRWGDGLPLVLGGFSFGAYVQMRLANRLAAAGKAPRQLVLVGMASGVAAGSSFQYETPAVPGDIPTLIIHGEVDDTVPLANVLAWARPQNLPVIVLPGADHFFHGRLNRIRELIGRNVAAAGRRASPD